MRDGEIIDAAIQFMREHMEHDGELYKLSLTEKETQELWDILNNNKQPLCTTQMV